VGKARRRFKSQDHTR